MYWQFSWDSHKNALGKNFEGVSPKNMPEILKGDPNTTFSFLNILETSRIAKTHESARLILTDTI